MKTQRRGDRGHISLIVIVMIIAALQTGTYGQTSDRDAKFRMAQALEQAAEYERAGAVYQELLKGDPSNYILFDGLQRCWIQLKKYDDVILLIRNRLVLSPADLNLRALLGSVLYRSGREKDAAAEWNAAVSADPLNPATYRFVASVLTENRLLDRAADIYRRGRMATGDPNLFTIELAQLLSASMDFAGATTEYLRWLQLNPTQLAFVQTRMASWTARDDARTAATNVVHTALRQKEDLTLLELLGWLAMEGKDYEQAFDVFRRVDVVSRAGGTSVYGFAERALREKAYEVAARAFREAIEAPLPPQRMPQAQYGYACALKELSVSADTLPLRPGAMPATEAHPLYVGAIARFQKIIDEYPHTEFSAKSYYQIGRIKFEKFVDHDGALASFGHVLEEVGTVNVLRYDVGLMIGRVQLARGDTAQAMAHFHAVAAASDALPDQSDEAVFRLAEINYFGNRFDDALKQLEGITVNLKADYANDALRLQTFLQENVNAAPEALRRFAGAEFLARQGKNTEAIPLLESIMASFPQAPLVDDALMTIALLQSSSGLYADAIATYERLLKQFRETSIALDRAQFRLAEVYQYGTREMTKAIATYEQLLADFPSSVLAAQARKRIRQLRGDPL